MRVKNKRSGCFRRRGAAIVEMAVVTPVLLMLLFGMIEFGWAFMCRQMIANSAREGAREAALQANVDDDAIRTAVRAALTSLDRVSVEDNDITITHWCKDSAGTPNFTETVQVSIDYSEVTLLSHLFSWITFDDIVVSSSMRKEGVTEDSTAPTTCP